MANSKQKTKEVKQEKEPVIQEPVVEKHQKKEEIDPNQFVIVRNGFNGTLVYQSSRTGELFVWDKFGDEQEMELRELKNAKSSSKSFFINNWFMFDDEWIIEYLGVGQYYKNGITVEEFDDMFFQPPSKLRSALSALSDGQKKTAAYRASELIASGEIDSLKTISVIEDVLGIELNTK